MMEQILSKIAQLAFLIPIYLIAATGHEVAHAAAAYWLGDDTAKRMGRISLNPLHHIDWLGFFALFIFGFGWFKPVIFVPTNFKRQKLYTLLTAYAGPASNFVMAFIAVILWKFFPYSYFPANVAVTANQFFDFLGLVNVVLGTFNLIPMPPLDGGHLVVQLLIGRYPGAVRWLYQFGFLILIGLLILVPETGNALMSLVTNVHEFMKHIFV